MIGMMGIDWAYGFDKIMGSRNMAAASSTSSWDRNSKQWTIDN